MAPRLHTIIKRTARELPITPNIFFSGQHEATTTCIVISYPGSSVGWVKHPANHREERDRTLGTRLVPWEQDYTSCYLATILNNTKDQANTLPLTLLRCDLSSLGLCRLVSPLELLLLFKLCGGIGGLEEFTGLNVMLCLVNVLIPGDISGVTLCRDPVPSRPADDSRTSWATEWSARIVMRG